MLEKLPEARAFDVPDFFRFQKKELRDVLDAMLNNENNDYSTVDEPAKSDRLSQYSYTVCLPYRAAHFFSAISLKNLKQSLHQKNSGKPHSENSPDKTYRFLYLYCGQADCLLFIFLVL